MSPPDWKLLFRPELRRSAVVLTVFCLFFNGCIQLEQDLTIRDDGSGTFTLQFAIADEMVNRVQAMRKLEHDLEAVSGESLGVPASKDLTTLLFNPTQAALESKLKEYEPLGISVEKLEVKSREARRQVSIKLAFKNIREAARADVFQEYGFSLLRRPDGNYLIYRGSASPQPGATRPSDPETERLLTPFLEGLSLSFTVHTPGKILATTAPIKGPYSATWLFEFNRDPNVLLTLQNQTFSILFEGEGLKLPTFSVPQQNSQKVSAAPNSATNKPSLVLPSAAN